MNLYDEPLLIFLFGVLLPLGAIVLGWLGAQAALVRHDPFWRRRSRASMQPLADEMTSAEFIRSLMPRYRNLQPSYSNPRPQRPSR